MLPTYFLLFYSITKFLTRKQKKRYKIAEDFLKINKMGKISISVFAFFDGICYNEKKYASVHKERLLFDENRIYEPSGRTDPPVGF